MSNSTISGIVSTAVTAFLAGALTFAATSWADYLQPFLTLCGTIAGFAAAITYQRYLGILSLDVAHADPLERLAYDKLRRNLEAGGISATFYSHWTTRFLNFVDRIFGDAGYPHSTLFPHAFGLKTPAPLWTARSFDRCMLLAATYPLTTLFVIWSISGHVGAAETMLRLRPDLSQSRRALEIFAVVAEGISIWGAVHFKGWRCLAWGVVGGGVSIFIAVSVAGSFSVALGFGFAGLIGGAVALLARHFGMAEFKSSFTGTAAIAGIAAGAVCMGTAGAANTIVGIVTAGFSAVAVAAAVTISYVALADSKRLGAFVLSIFLTLTLICFAAPYFLASWHSWGRAGTMLLFIVLLPLLNAPFDWLSIGITRALLRRGIERAGGWPLFYSLVDIFLAALIIFALALVMLIGIECFNTLAILGGGGEIIPLKQIFDRIEGDPAAPEFWWIYALLLSTMIPSLINLAIGGASLIRGLPGLSKWLLRSIPAGRAPPAFERLGIAAVLTLQIYAGGALGLALPVVLIATVIEYAMPMLGKDLLDISRAVVSFDLLPQH